MAGFTAFHRARSGVVIGLIVALFASAFVNFRPADWTEQEEGSSRLLNMLERAELWFFDVRMRFAARDMPARSPVVMVNVDDETVMGSVSQSRPWPWKRSVLTELITELSRLGASQIVVDPVLIQARASWKEESAFAESLEHFPQVIIGFEFTDLTPQLSPPEGRFAFPVAVFPNRREAYKYVAGTRPRLGSAFYLLETTAENAASSEALWAEAMSEANGAAARSDNSPPAAAQVKTEAPLPSKPADELKGTAAAGSGKKTGKKANKGKAQKNARSSQKKGAGKNEAQNEVSAASAAAAAGGSGGSAAAGGMTVSEAQTPQEESPAGAPLLYPESVTLWRGGLSDRAAAEAAAPGPVSRSAIRELTSREMFSRITSDTILTEVAALRHPDVVNFPESFRSPQLMPRALLTSGARFAIYDIAPSFDGVMRKIPPVVRHDGKFYPSVALRLASALNPDADLKITASHVIWNNTAYSLDDQGQMGLRYYGNAARHRLNQPFDEISAASIFRSAERNASGRVTDKAVRERVSGKVIFLSPTSSILHGGAETPVGAKTKAFVWAMALENFLRGSDFVRAERTFDGWVAFLMALLGGLGTALSVRMLRRTASALNWAFLTCCIFTVFALYQHQSFDSGLWVGAVIPILACIVSSSLTAFYVTADGMRAVGRVWDALGRTTPVKTTEALLLSPKSLMMKGEKRTLTMFYFDVIHFTERVSEKTEPEKLVRLMRELWTLLSDEVCHTGGQVGHVVGDSMISYWGAPLENRRHAYDACRCALAVKALCARRRKTWMERYGVDLEGALTLATGEMIIGDFGCGGVRPSVNYMPLGGALSQTKLLNKLSARWNGRILMTENVVREVEGQVESRCLGITKNRGGFIPVYELMALKGGLPKAARNRLNKYNQAFTLITKRDFLSAKTLLLDVLKEDKDDAPAAMLLARCDQCIAVPPPESWQGFFEIT